MRILAVAALLGAQSMIVSAQDAAGEATASDGEPGYDFSYSFLDISAGYVDILSGGTASGFDFSLEAGDRVFIFGGYSRARFDQSWYTIDIDTLNAGLGVRGRLSTASDWYATIAYADFDRADNGVSVGGGMRSRLAPRVESEVFADITHIDADNVVALGARILWRSFDHVGFGAGLAFNDDGDASYQLFMRIQ